MDPLADKLLILGGARSLVQLDLARRLDRSPRVILGREFAVTILRGIAHGREVVIAASPLGKFKMVSSRRDLALILGQNTCNSSASSAPSRSGSR
jgi:phosphatidylglycerophosphate synthase